MPFDLNVSELSSSDLDHIFEDTSNFTPNANNLVLGKQNDNQEIETFDDSLLQTEEDLKNEKVEKVEKEEKTEIKVDEKEVKVEKEEEENKTDILQVNEALKNTVDYLVQQGLWLDFEGRENLEISQEVYAELATKQAQNSAYDIVNELIDSTGDYGKAIISHIKAGGNPDEIIDLFKEQKSIESIDTSTEKGKQFKIEKYFKDVLGWKPEKVEKHVNRLVENNEIDSEFEEIQELYDKHYKTELFKQQEIVKAEEQKNIERQNIFVKNIKETLDSDISLNDRDKKVIASSILDFRHKLDNGQKVNDFYIKFAEMQNDPKKYVKLVRFVIDNENYEKQLRQQEKTEVSKEVFNFIKGNSTIKNKSSNLTIDENVSSTNKKRGTDFSFIKK